MKWTKTPTETGAYWAAVSDMAPDICWINSGYIAWPDGLKQFTTVAECVSRGMSFYGPLERPPAPISGEVPPMLSSVEFTESLRQLGYHVEDEDDYNQIMRGLVVDLMVRMEERPQGEGSQ